MRIQQRKQRTTQAVWIWHNHLILLIFANLLIFSDLFLDLDEVSTRVRRTSGVRWKYERLDSLSKKF